VEHEEEEGATVVVVVGALVPAVGGAAVVGADVAAVIGGARVGINPERGPNAAPRAGAVICATDEKALFKMFCKTPAGREEAAVRPWLNHWLDVRKKPELYACCVQSGAAADPVNCALIHTQSQPESGQKFP